MRSELPTRQAVEEKIFDLLAARRPGATICPSEVARALEADVLRAPGREGMRAPGLAPGAEVAQWREAMPLVREVAHELALAGRVVVTRRGVGVGATSGGGPIRIGLSSG